MNAVPLRWFRALAFLACLTPLLLTSTLHADLRGRTQSILNAADLRKTRIGIYIYDLDRQQTLVDINGDEPMIPASNMKVLTSAAALQTLGPDFVFRTELRYLPGGPTAGPRLVIIGDGDPAFGDATLLSRHGLDAEKLLDAWIQAIAATGVRQFDQIIVDDRVFDDNFVHSTWPADQLNQWYCAQVTGLIFNNNCLDLLPEPTTPGQTSRVRIWPDAPIISITNRSVTGNADTFWVSRKADSNELTFYGKVKSRRSRPINVTLHDTPIFFGELIRHRLASQGIVVNEVIRPAHDAQLPAGQTLHVIQTTIDQVLDRCNKDSQNLFAESLFKRMGRKVTGQPGSWENGGAAMRMFLRQRLGARSATLSIADGSGMSRENRITARTLSDVIVAMARDPQLNRPFLQSLSVGGKDGTLRNRFTDLKGTVVLGKSGYINKVSTLSGLVIVTDPNRPQELRTVAFALMFNDFDPPVYVSHVRDVQNKLVRMIHEHIQGQMTVPAAQ